MNYDERDIGPTDDQHLDWAEHNAHADGIEPDVAEDAACSITAVSLALTAGDLPYWIKHCGTHRTFAPRHGETEALALAVAWQCPDGSAGQNAHARPEYPETEGCTCCQTHSYATVDDEQRDDECPRCGHVLRAHIGGVWVQE